MKKFRLHWRTGKPDDVEGTDIADAMRRRGYGAGVIKALDYWEELKRGIKGGDEKWEQITNPDK